jgi:CubicO group peptidase (beta-lactamase class C family)
MNFSNVDLKKLDKELSEFCEKNPTYGMFRVTVKDKIVFEKHVGYANIEKKTPFTSDSMFTFYSLSKPFCVIGLMKLYDRGLVDLDRHPSAYVPEAEGFDERVTIRHMLHHVSGLPDFEQTKEFKELHNTGYAHELREHVKEITKYPQKFAPGTDTQYANINMCLCALIIENVTGRSYSEYMKAEVFEPFGMKTAVVDDENLFIENRVQGYTYIDGEFKATEKSHDWMFGAGDIVGTLDDVYALNRAIKNKTMLKPETWQEILTAHPKNSFGCGCIVSDWHGKLTITHNGGAPSFRSYHKQIPEDDFDLILLINGVFLGGSVRIDLSEIIYSAFYTDNPTASEEKLELDKGYI